MCYHLIKTRLQLSSWECNCKAAWIPPTKKHLLFAREVMPLGRRTSQPLTLTLSLSLTLPLLYLSPPVSHTLTQSHTHPNNTHFV